MTLSAESEYDDRSLVEMPDEALVRLAQERRSAFGPLYRKYAAAIYRYALRLLRSPAMAEDATSATFMRALSALPRFDPESGTFRAWLFAIAHNAIVDQIRDRDRRQAQPLETVEEIESALPSPESSAIDRELARTVDAALAHMTTEQRSVVELRLAGLTGPEIAAVLSITHGAVRAAQRRALLRLRELLGDADCEAFSAPGRTGDDKR
jgi:RNA polymerase sigma-70 factor (ECF subfamily)